MEGQAPGDLISSMLPRIPNQVNLRELIAQLERTLIARSLELAHGVQAEAARKLGLSRSDLGYKLGRHGLSGLPGTSPITDDRSGASTLDHT